MSLLTPNLDMPHPLLRRASPMILGDLIYNLPFDPYPPEALCQHSGPNHPISLVAMRDRTYGLGLFWCKEDERFSVPLLTAASLFPKRCGGPSRRVYMHVWSRNLNGHLH